MSAPAPNAVAPAAPTPITGATNPKVEPGQIKIEDKKQGGGGGGGGPNNNQGGQGMNRGGKRRRGGGPMGNSMGGGGGGRGGFQGGGGRGGHQQGGGGDRRSGNFGGMGMGMSGQNQNMGMGMMGHDNSFDGGPPSMKKPKISGIDGRVLDRLRQISGPTVDLPPRKFEVKKFLANTRLYIGNLPNEVSEPEIKDLFLQYGEVDEVFINRDKNFAFLKLDYRTSAERARAELDQRHIRNRPIKVRFAPATVRVKVKNLSPMVSNELLELGFSVFGDIERALVFVDDKGKSLGEGFVDFTRKNNAVQAHKICSDKCFFLTADLRPVITEMGDMCEVDEGLLEMNLPKREFTKGREIEYYQQRGVGPRFAEEGSFDDQFGQKWKKVLQEHKEKELSLKNELDKELEKIQAEMEIQKYEFETEMLRQQLKQRELDHERQKIEWENRMQRMPRQGGGPYGGGGGGGFMNGGPGGQGPPLMDTNPNDMCGPPDGGMGGGMPMNDYDQYSDMNMRGMGGGNNGPNQMAPLPPPPMPPQGLMAHLGEPQGPTWERRDSVPRNSSGTQNQNRPIQNAQGHRHQDEVRNLVSRSLDSDPFYEDEDDQIMEMSRPSTQTQLEQPKIFVRNPLAVQKALAPVSQPKQLPLKEPLFYEDELPSEIEQRVKNAAPSATASVSFAQRFLESDSRRGASSPPLLINPSRPSPLPVPAPDPTWGSRSGPVIVPLAPIATQEVRFVPLMDIDVPPVVVEPSWQNPPIWKDREELGYYRGRQTPEEIYTSDRGGNMHFTTRYQQQQRAPSPPPERGNIPSIWDLRPEIGDIYDDRDRGRIHRSSDLPRDNRYDPPPPPPPLFKEFRERDDSNSNRISRNPINIDGTPEKDRNRGGRGKSGSGGRGGRLGKGMFLV